MNNSHSSLALLALPDPRTMAVTASIVYSDELGRNRERWFVTLDSPSAPSFLSPRAISSIVARSPPGDYSSLKPTLIFELRRADLDDAEGESVYLDEMWKFEDYSASLKSKKIHP